MDAERVAIVTAAGKGIGEACARRLTEDGYTPVLLSKSGAAVDVAEDLGGVGFEGSVTEPDDLDALVATANSTPYGLTAGLFTRSERDIARVTSQLRAGNIYVNRGTTGAVVGRQPFGGFGHSGVGSKAGGPDYLHQFVNPVVTTENTVRAGFTPDLLT